MSLPKVQILCNPEELVLYINGFVHLHLIGKRVGIQGWVESESDCEYCIHWYVDQEVRETKYWSKDLWKKILQEYKRKVVKIK